MTDIVSATVDYETWLRNHVTVVEADLALKHTELADTPLRFLRGTYYYWLRGMKTLLPSLLEAPSVPLVGDLHAENFGTWRDHHGVTRWGVNDLDELGHGPYPIDLARLAASCVLSPHVALDDVTICDILLDGWLTTTPGPAVKIEEAEHLQHLLPDSHGETKYYAALAATDPIDPAALPAVVVHLVETSVDGKWTPTWHRRQAGTGSLGHQRVVAVADTTAREVKELGPASAEWADVRACTPDATLYTRVQEAVHGPSPASRSDGWQLRALAPDEVRIEISALHAHATERVLHSMAHAVVNIHGVGDLDAARKYAKALPKHWLHQAVATMTADTRAAYTDWRQTRQ